SICVYEAPNSTQSWINEWTRIAADNTAKIVSCSWGMTEQDSPTRAFDYNIFQQMATQGQAVFVASGDNGAYNGGGTTLAVDEPACQPYVTAVGISKLTMGANSSYVSETASVYGGGGVSAYLAIPSYQAPLAVAAAKTAKVSTTKRNLPDVALTADAATPYAFYINGTWGGYYGSSISAPIWAAFTACVNEGLGSKGPIGFVNPALYQLAQTSNYTGYFHDITTGNNKYYPAALNFDDATGLGSFNGLNLYNGLVNGFAIDLPPSAPTITSVTAGNAQVSLSWTAVTGATSYVVTRSASSSLANPTVFTGITATTYTNTSLANGTTYYYAVAGVNAAGQGSNSTVVSATPSASVSSVAAPTNLTGSATTYMKMPAFALQWKQSVSPNITRNNIYYSIGNGGYSKLGNVPATTSITVIIIGASRGVTYNFYVTAVNSKGVEGPGSNKIGVVL
ncbi:MAG: hypothetical protein WCG78_08285, partial [Candidatus Omnitrophota bacterium]